MTDIQTGILFKAVEEILEKLNSLPDLISQAVEQAFAKYLVADAEQPEPAAPAEESAEIKAYNAIVAARVRGITNSITLRDLNNLSWSQLAHLIAYSELSGITPEFGGYSKEFVATATERSKIIVKNIKTVTSDEIMKYLESQQ